MGYDISIGEDIARARHVLSIDEYAFDAFVEFHRAAVPPYRFASRLMDPYGDAVFAANEVATLSAEIADIERRCPVPNVRALCKSLRAVLGEARAHGESVFCFGD